MQDNTKIVFQKERNSYEILSSAFAFYKSNYKDILNKNMIKILPFFLLLIAIYQISGRHTANFMTTSQGFWAFFFAYLWQQFIILLFVTIIQACILTYIKYYIDEIDYDKRSYTKIVFKYFSSLFILNFVVILATVIASFFFLLPGIYLHIALLLTPVILVFEDKSPLESINYSFKFIKNNWGSIFYTLFLMILITLLFSMTTTLIEYFYSTFKNLFIESGSYMYSPNRFNDPFLFFLHIVSLIIILFLYIYLVIVYALMYFNIVEKTSHSNIFSEIDKIGENFD